MKRSIKLTFLFIFIIGFYGCDDLLNSAIECSIKDVKIKDKVLRVATKDQNYYETITAEVTNDPNDEDYNYQFVIIGKLPSGINQSKELNKLILNGIPTETGEFPFKVEVTVTYYTDGAVSLCSESAQNSFTLIVN